MTEGHAGSGKAHHLADTLARLAPLAMDRAILAVGFVTERAGGCTLERRFYGFATRRAQPRIVFGAFVMRRTVDAADGLERAPILFNMGVFYCFTCDDSTSYTKPGTASC